MAQEQSARNQASFSRTSSVDDCLDGKTRTSVSWALPLAIAGVLVVGDSASAENDIYGYVGANGVFEMTNVPTDGRFRPAELQRSRLIDHLSKKLRMPLSAMPGSSTCTQPCCWL